MNEHDGALHSHGQARTHDQTLSQPQITKRLWEEITHRVGLANRSEGGNNECQDAPEPAQGISLIGVGIHELRRLGFLGLVDLLALAMFPGRVSWFECCRSSYLKEDWIAS